MTNQRSAPSRSRTLAAALMLCAGLTLSACDKGDPASDAIAQAQRMLSSMTAGGMSVSPSPTMRAKQFESISAIVTPYLDAKTPGAARAANLIKAQILAGKGDLALETASAPLAQVGAQVTRIRQMLDTYLGHIARAQAEEKYSPADQLKDLDTQLVAVSDKIAQAALAKDKLAAQIKAKLQQADELTATAKTARAQAATIQQGAQSVSAVEGLKLFQQAAEARRGADAQDVQASALQSEVSVLQPQVDQLARDIAALTHNRDSLNAAKKGLTERAEIARKGAAEARTDAGKVAQDIDAAVQGINQLRSSAEFAKLEEALKLYREAASSTGKTLAMSSGAETSSVKLTAAGFKQSLGETQFAKGRMLRNLAETLDRLANASMPQSASYKSAATEAKAAADAEIKAAQDTLTEVVTAYEAAKDQAQTTEQFKSRMASAAAALKAVASETGAAPAAEPAAATKPATTEPTKPVAAGDSSAAEAGAKKWIDAYQDAYRSGDTAGMMKFFNLQPNERAGMEAVLGLGESMRSLDKALRAKMNKSLKDVMTEVARSNPMAGQMVEMTTAMEMEQKMKDRTSADFDIKVNSPTSVTVSPKVALSEKFDTAHTLVLVDGQWLAELGDEEKMGMSMGAAMFKPISKLFSGLTADVESGKIADSAQFSTQFSARMMALMQGAGGGMGGPDVNK